MPDSTTSVLCACLVRLNTGDPAARDELITRAQNRLRRLVHTMFRDFSRLKHVVEADDVLQNAVMRLLQALKSVAVDSVGEFFRLAAMQIRRELLDLVRHHFGPEGPAANLAPQSPVSPVQSTSTPPYEPVDSTLDPSRLLDWAHFHESIEQLPARERMVVDLLWYHEMTQAEAALVLNVSEPSIKRWWLSARVRLRQALGGEDHLPAESGI